MSHATSLVTTKSAVREQIEKAKQAGLRIGFVPTMGALHQGHLRLVEECRKLADFVVVSIFVNPTQFGPNEDLSKYPRTLDQDLRLCEEGGATLIFAPSADEIYPSGKLSTFVEVPALSSILEGATRPGHFRGVATVVLKLFQIVQPDLAVFGQKDYQQLLVIRHLVDDLDVPVEVFGIPTVRESDGLAMSSRNRYLNAEDRAAAVVLSQALGEATAAVKAGERSGDRVRQILRSRIECQSRAQLDYAEVVDASTLESIERLGEGREAVALIAARIGPARLIDNALLSE